MNDPHKTQVITPIHLTPSSLIPTLLISALDLHIHLFTYGRRKEGPTKQDSTKRKEGRFIQATKYTNPLCYIKITNQEITKESVFLTFSEKLLIYNTLPYLLSKSPKYPSRYSKLRKSKIILFYKLGNPKKICNDMII